MILTPQERRALLTLVTLLFVGQGVSLWQEHRRSRPDRELSAWLTRLEAVRADTASAVAAVAEPLRPASPDSARSDRPDEPEASASPEPSASQVRGPAEPAGLGPSGSPMEEPRRVPIEPVESIPPGVLESGRLQINRASARDLEALPGIGPAMARRIIEERARGGPFLRPQDLLRVKGIGPKKLARLQDRVDWSLPGGRAAPRSRSRRCAPRRRAAWQEMAA